MLMDAAQTVDPGFKIMIMPDMAVFGYKPEKLAPYVKELAAHPAALRLDDGRLVVSPYATDAFSANWWKEWLADMRDGGVDIAFIPFPMLNWDNAASFKDISYGLTIWGAYSPNLQTETVRMREQARNYTDLWMMPVRAQDVRPRSYTWHEAGNSENYRVMWKNSIEYEADWVHLITWNDYSESTMAPSTGVQYAFYDLTAYYNVWFKTGVEPVITHDAMYYFYRRHHTNLTPSVMPPLPAVPKGSDPPQNTIELLAFLTEPGILEIQIGATRQTKEVPAGVSSFQIPLKKGTPIFRLYRNKQKVITLPGIFEIKGSIKYQDHLYYGGSNTREQNEYPELLYKID